MLIRDLYSLSLHNLFLHKIRSLLTSLGIIFGVGSVIAMLAISGGAKKEALSQIEAMGVDNIIVYSKESTVEEGDDSQGRVSRYGLTEVDRKHILKMDNIKQLTSVRNARLKVRKGIKQLDLQVVGVTAGFLDDTNTRVSQGRWLSHADYKNSSTVCVIGKNAKRKLFNLGEQDIIGKMISVRGGAFRIVGVVENNSGTTLENLNSPNDLIYVPTTTAKKIFTDKAMEISSTTFKITHIEHDLFIIKVDDIRSIDNTAKRIKSYLDKTHTKSKDWGINVPLDLLKQREATQNIFTIVMGSIAGISLVVGGIGIMNIMLANVYERRKEIGTRRAIGAKKKDILYQFLIEAVFLTVMGGLIGVALGVGLSTAVTHFSGMPSEVSMWSIIGSITISGLVGVLFGTYPAWQAANQNPINALKAE